MVYDIPGLRFQRQANPHWCWAAVAWMVMDFYSQGQGLAQCQIAAQLTRGNCCPPPADPNDSCFNLMNLGDALSVVGHAGQPLDQPQEFSLVKSQILAKNPLCAQMAMPGMNHYVVLSTCADDGGIRVFDPEGWYDTDFDTFTRFDPTNPHGYCTGWFLTR